MTDIDDLGHPVEPEHIKVPYSHRGNTDTAYLVESDGTITIQRQGEPTEWIQADVDSHVGVEDSEYLDKRLKGML